MNDTQTDCSCLVMLGGVNEKGEVKSEGLCLGLLSCMWYKWGELTAQIRIDKESSGSSFLVFRSLSVLLTSIPYHCLL